MPAAPSSKLVLVLVVLAGCAGRVEVSRSSGVVPASTGWESRETCAEVDVSGSSRLYVPPGAELVLEVDGGPTTRIPASSDALRATRERWGGGPLVVLPSRVFDGEPVAPTEVEWVARLASDAGWRVTVVCRRPTPEPARPPGATPGPREVVIALRPASERMSACAPGFGTVQARMTFRGSDGALVEVSFPSGLLDPSLEQCVRRALEGTRVPPFSGESFVVSYPFRL